MVGQGRVGDARDAEVGDLRSPLREHDVLGFHVAVKNTPIVRHAQAVAELDGKVSDLREGSRPARMRCFNVGPSTYSKTK